MRIGQLAQRAGVSRDALRLYERAGLIVATRRANGYREYAEDSVVRLLLIRTGQRLGFSLAQIAEATAGVDRLADAAEREAAVTRLLETQLARVDEQLAELQALRHELAERVQGGCPAAPAAQKKGHPKVALGPAINNPLKPMRSARA
jgi:MerR family copper efflux transcriptional regulator